MASTSRGVICRAAGRGSFSASGKVVKGMSCASSTWPTSTRSCWRRRRSTRTASSPPIPSSSSPNTRHSSRRSRISGAAMHLPDIETFVDANGAVLWTATRGSGYPILLLHGGPGLCDYLEPVADMLGHLATAHRYEQRGCGRSPQVEPITFDTLVSDIEALRET